MDVVFSCPFSRGDRVEHTRLGYGTVLDEPQLTFGPLSMNKNWENNNKKKEKVASSGSGNEDTKGGGDWVVMAGWTIPVEWDNRKLGISLVGYQVGADPVIRKRPPKARGRGGWQSEYDYCLSGVMKARAEVEAYLRNAHDVTRSFDPTHLASLRDAEDIELEKLQSFLMRGNSEEFK